jgi:hypothetical protein
MATLTQDHLPGSPLSHHQLDFLSRCFLMTLPPQKPNVRYTSAGKITTIQTTRPFRESSTTQAIRTNNDAMRVDNPHKQMEYMGAKNGCVTREKVRHTQENNDLAA